MNLLQLREREIFNTLNSIRNYNFVVIGGYAVNSYTLPRFSIDCDIVVKKEDLLKLKKQLVKLGYKKIYNNFDSPYTGEFERYEKKIKENFNVNIDILIDKVFDRQTNSLFDAEWIFKNSKIHILNAKTNLQKLQVRIINLDALFVMKFVSCRSTDIRDIFMINPNIKNRQWVVSEINKRINFNKHFIKIKNKINSKQFKDGLQGVYGFIDYNIFNKHKKELLKLVNIEI